MYERESSVASSVDFYESDGKLNAPAGHMQNDASAGKRKAEDASSVADKKRRLRAHVSSLVSTQLSNCAGLPPAVWQHIFSFCSLADFGRLIQVNRSFHSYLTDVSDVSLSSPESRCLHLSLSEALWASARNAYNSNAPKPFSGLTERHMWQLVWSKRCQFCNRLDASVAGEKLWQQGPGELGVRTIWPFGIRACGPCLMQQCQTDASLLFSAASALRPALPFALITTDHNYIPAHALQSTTTPATVEIGKYYYKKHVADITQEMVEALALGPAAAEEWAKGLEQRGKQRINLAETWERWSARDRDTKPAVTRSPAATARKPSKSPKRQTVSPIIHAPVPAKPATPNTQFAHQRPPTIPPNVFTPQPGLTGSTQPNQQRNLHDANEAKATRKTDIERRCQQMNPPIAPNILRHMDAFKAAIQISQPMNDYAWSVLQPRLIANLPAAQQAEADHVSRVALLPTKTTDRRHQDANSKEAKEAMDREWEESQRPIRDRLSVIADDFINSDWDHGKALTYENSPKFAADLLIYVRRNYYEEASGSTATLQPMEGDPSDRRPPLVLENMKWVYDNKLKPLTEQYRRELFLCHGNDCDQATRLFGFEGVIQHYGAKHTNAFSSGNVVVAWREAEWPEETPFHPDPISMKHTSHGSSNGTGYGGYYGGFSRAGTSTPHMPTHIPPHMPQASPGPYQYGSYNGPYAPPQVPYDYSQVYGAPAEGHPYHSMGPPGYGHHPGGPSYMPSPAVINPAVAPPPAMPPPPHGVIDPASNGEDASHSTASFDKEVSTIIGLAQDMWKQTSGIKDMPNSLRIYVLLHRVISKFHIEFNYEPNLNHFIGALSNHEISKALKNAPGLSCKACQLQSTHHLTGAYYTKPEERRTYTVLTLFQHFRSQHQHPATNPSAIGYGQASTALDWKEEMIELPSERIISGLIHAPGMDDEKLLMIATTFPSLFPHPLPTIGKIEDDGLTSPSSSGPMRDALRASGTPGVALERSGVNARASRTESPRPSKPTGDEDSPERPPTAGGRSGQAPGLGNKKRSHRNTTPEQRGERYYDEPRYYLARDQPDDGYPRREFVEYAPSPRIYHAAPVYNEYSGRRTGFRDTDSYYGPPREEVVYARPHEGGHSREYSTHVRHVRYAEDDGQYPSEVRPREASGPRGQSAADRFLEEFVPEQPPATEEQLPPPRPDSGPPVSAHEDEDNGRYTPPRLNPPPPSEPEALARPLVPPQQPPSTVSNQSGYEAPNGRHIPTPDSQGPPPPRRPGPQRRRDRPHDQRMPSRYYRYMSVAAREDPYGRAPSITRSQRSRYEEQRRRIDEAETPQPTTERDRAYEPTYSREHSIEHLSPEHIYPPARPEPRGYVSVQDRTHHFSPPRYHRYDDPRVPAPPVYYDDYGQPEYEIVRVRGDYRQPRPYMSEYRQPAPVRYEPYHDPYIYGRPPPQRYNSRPEEYVHYEDRERERLPQRPVHEAEAEPPEPPPVGVKIEVATPAPGIQD